MANIKFSQDIVDEFNRITNVDLLDLFNKFILFIEFDYQNIVDYYSGSIDKPSSQSFKNLENLQREYRGVLQKIQESRDSFTSSIFWEILDQVEEISAKLKTIENTPKWLRSSIGKNNFNPNIQIDYTLKYGQTLEGVEKNVMSSTDPDNEWVQLAFDNDIKEEDYNINGGNRIKITLKNGSLFNIQSIVDTITEAVNVYGRDIDRVITFENDDIKVLSGKETLYQTVDILANLRRGDNPEFPEDGINEKFVVGSNISAIQFPSLFRQLALTFAKDDSLKNFTLINIEQKDDYVALEFSVATRLDEVITQRINI